MFWSYLLAGIGVFGLILVIKKKWAGYAVGVSVQILWIAYAFATQQYGFIASAMVYGTVNAIGLRVWLLEDKKEKEK